MLANRLEDTTLHSTELSDIFHTVLSENPSIKQAALADIVAFKERVRERTMRSANGTRRGTRRSLSQPETPH